MNDKVSIIIPTLQINTNILNKLLDELVTDDIIGEIIIIDNSLKGIEYFSNKIRVIVPRNNLYVNPSWNLGVKEAKNQYIGILNDDLLLPKNYCKQILEFLKNTDNVGLVGLNSEVVSEQKQENSPEYPQDTQLTFSKMDKIYETMFWGSAIFGKKTNFYEIPNDMKIWCGDNYLLLKNQENKKQNYEVSNCNILHLHSLSSKKTSLDKIKINDIAIMNDIFPNDSNKKINYKFIELLFSIKNINQKKYKLITIMGFKIKIKNKKYKVLAKD